MSLWDWIFRHGRDKSSTWSDWRKLPRNHPSRRKGYKYRTTRVVIYKSDLLRGAVSETVVSSGGYVTLTPEGVLTIRKGYAWDGASGPTIDTLNTMLASLVHDALYQLMREKLIDRSKYRARADLILRELCIQQGMSEWRANFWAWAVLQFGRRSAT